MNLGNRNAFRLIKELVGESFAMIELRIQNPVRRTRCNFSNAFPTHWFSKQRCKLTVAMSMEAVASSMMSILLFRTKALAKQNSCLCPTLKFSPPSVTVASEAA